MPKFPQRFLDDLRLQADIVQVVQEYVSLRRVGNTYKGLCPFHGEKTPSFHVDREKGYFHCFGCQVGGNVYKFVELQEKVSFPEAVRIVAQKFGVALPDLGDGSRDAAAEAERDSLLHVHELAAAFYRQALAGPAGGRGRELLAARRVAPETIDRLGLGFAPPGRDLLLTALKKKGISNAVALKSGLVVERDGRLLDRFWNRLMIPICREGGSVIAFGGRATEAQQLPKYLNSPETPIYTKSRTLYGLNLTRGDIRRLGYAVLVEGYFDFAQTLQGGVRGVVATCGTALTLQQAQMLRRFVSRVVLSFDPDAAGEGAAVRSCELLVREGFDVAVALLPQGEDPDAFVRARGGPAYQALVDGARPYLDFLIDRAARQHDLKDSRGRLSFLNAMLTAAATIPNAPARDQFADRVALRAGVSEDVVRQEIRRAAVGRKTELPQRRVPGLGELVPAERDLLAQVLSDPAAVVAALTVLDERDLDGLAARPVLEAVRELAGVEPESLPGRLLERLTEEEVTRLTGLAARIGRPVPAAECVRELKFKRLQRERLDLQRQIDSLRESSASVADAEITALLARKQREAEAAQIDAGMPINRLRKR